MNIISFLFFFQLKWRVLPWLVAPGGCDWTQVRQRKAQRRRRWWDVPHLMSDQSEAQVWGQNPSAQRCSSSRLTGDEELQTRMEGSQAPWTGRPRTSRAAGAWSGGGHGGFMHIQSTHAHGRRRRDEEQVGVYLLMRRRKWKFPQQVGWDQREYKAACWWLFRPLPPSTLSRAIMWFILLLYQALPELVSAQGKSQRVLLYFIAFFIHNLYNWHFSSLAHVCADAAAAGNFGAGPHGQNLCMETWRERHYRPVCLDIWGLFWKRWLVFCFW